MDIRTILQNMTKEEKAALVSGTEFMYTNRIPRLGVPALRMSDGPHGLRVQAEGGDNGVTGSLPATAFPTAACTASGWNPENVRRMGEAIAAEGEAFDTSTVCGAIEYIIQYVRDTWHCPVVFYTNAYYESAEYSAMVDVLFSIQEKYGIGVIELYTDTAFNAISEESRALWMADAIHPTRAGYLQWWTPKMEQELFRLFPKA